ncbi:MAG: LysR family transcriptional regulator [Candidatus Bathyarchaeota archaeon]|nr:LysR family transcriptional regulator [Candidatus Bathyarchaeota archaeon]MCX8177096.1 LysR family transcriptional regulator [Candidatus Bathyarchaeota archaeon]MDW8193733.1 LysR family transcriptional regulator [Nitrososphaerota archaeon]
MQHKPSCKVWLEYGGKPLIGRGGAEILEEIERQQSISKAAKRLGMSYRYVWSYVRKMEKTLGASIIETFRGGRAGGGGARLTAAGKSLLEEYRLVGKRMEGLLSKVRAGCILRGRVKMVEEEDAAVKFTVELEAPAQLTMVLSRDRAKELGLKAGEPVEVYVSVPS